jgi:hypothetical protein
VRRADLARRRIARPYTAPVPWLADASGSSTVEVQRVILLFVVTALALLVAFLAAVLLVLGRRRRRGGREPARPPGRPPLDPWQEAARRATPYGQDDE